MTTVVLKVRLYCADSKKLVRKQVKSTFQKFLHFYHATLC